MRSEATKPPAVGSFTKEGVSGELQIGSEGWVQEIQRSSRAFIYQVKPFVRDQIVLVEPIFFLHKNPKNCLAEHVTTPNWNERECDQTGYESEGVILVRQQWREVCKETNVTCVDPSTIFCPKGICPARINGTIAYVSEDHLSWDYAILKATELETWFF